MHTEARLEIHQDSFSFVFHQKCLFPGHMSYIHQRKGKSGKGFSLQETRDAETREQTRTHTHTRTFCQPPNWLELLGLEIDRRCVPTFLVFTFKYSLCL